MPSPTLNTNVLSDGDMDLTFGGRIFECRRNAGMSLQMLANLVGVKPSTLRAWENDRSEPRVNKIVAMSGILGVSPTYFLAEEGHSGDFVTATKGRNNKLIAMLKEEMLEINEQQKSFSKRLRKINTIIKKL